MISISPKTFININPDGNGGYYIWIIQEVNSLQGIVKECERSADGKWLFLHECEHVWTMDQLVSRLNMRATIHGNIYMITKIEGLIYS